MDGVDTQGKRCELGSNSTEVCIPSLATVCASADVVAAKCLLCQLLRPSAVNVCTGICRACAYVLMPDACMRCYVQKGKAVVALH